MTTESQFISDWRQYLAEPTAGLHLADPGHPLGMFVGKTDAGMARMVIRVGVRPSKPNLSRVVLVERYEDAPGKWTLSFTLQDKRFAEVFLRLVADIHGRTAFAADATKALEIVDRVFDEWKRLLRPRALGLLSPEALRGLIGELWLLVDHFGASRSMGASVAGWLGPLGLPQDFWYADDGYHEAKSVGPATTALKITSESQLDADGLDLHVLRVANSAEGAGAMTLSMLVSRVANRLKEEGLPTDELDDRLERLGVVLDEPAYQDSWFVVAQHETYGVTEDFPSVRASLLQAGVSRVRYQIDLTAIEPFKTATQRVV